MPDALVLGTGFFSLVTLSFSYGMFFVALLESLGIYHFLRTTNNRLGIVPLIPLRESLGARCRSGITTLSASSLSLFGGLVSPQFPSAPLFIMGVAGAYVLMSMQVLSRELEAMGKEFTTRYYVAQVAIPLLVLFLVAYRIFYACDSPGNALLSVVLGAIVGALLIEQNRRLFGESSLNLIGVPLLRQRTASGEKLYICPTQSKI
jgi:hypothetical protein